MVQVPLGEWSCVNLNNTVFNESFSSNEFVVGCVIDDVDNSGLSGDCFRSPVEVTFLESESSKLVVTSSDSDSSDSWLVIDELSVGYGSGFLESSLFFMDWHSAACQSSFMSWISWDTHKSHKIIIFLWENILI